MTQYAAFSGTPIIEKDDFSGFRSEELFVSAEGIRITYSEWDDFYSEIDKLIVDKKYREAISKEYQNALPNRESFVIGLQDIFSGELSMYQSKKVDVDLNKILTTNLLAAKYKKNEISRLMINFVVAKYNPGLFLRESFKYLCLMDFKELKINIRKLLCRLIGIGGSKICK